MRKTYHLARAEIGTLEWADGSNPAVDRYFDVNVHSKVARGDHPKLTLPGGGKAHRRAAPK